MKLQLPADAAQFLPHKPPMRFVQTLLDAGDSTVTCETTIDENTFAPFLDDSRQLPASHLVEIMAQTIAAWSGYHDIINNQPLHSGLFLSCRHFTTKLPAIPLNTTLRITAKKIMLIETTATFEATITTQGGARSPIAPFEASPSPISKEPHKHISPPTPRASAVPQTSKSATLLRSAPPPHQSNSTPAPNPPPTPSAYSLLDGDGKTLVASATLTTHQTTWQKLNELLSQQ